MGDGAVMRARTYIADGLTASLTSDLSRIRDAFIINAATAFADKDKPVTAQQVAGQRFVVEADVAGESSTDC
jgi:TolB-like protein